MEQQEKLSKFQTAVFSEIDAKVDVLRREAEESVSQQLQQNKEEQMLRSAEEIQKKTQEISKDCKREIAKYGLEAKREILQKRQELTEQVFESVAGKLLKFQGSKEYNTYLLGLIQAFSEEHALANCKILVGEKDFSLAAKIKKAYALPCEVLSDKSITLGGFVVRADGDGAFYDETLSQKLSEQKNYFIENSELYL